MYRNESGSSNASVRGTSPSSCLANLHAGKTKVTCRPLALACLRLQAVWLWLAVVSLPFQGPRPRGSFCIERAIAYPTPDANKAHHSLPLLFACLPAWTHHTTIHYVPPYLTLHTLLAPPIHSLHPAPIFISAAPPTLIKCLQTPRSNHE